MAAFFFSLSPWASGSNPASLVLCISSSFYYSGNTEKEESFVEFAITVLINAIVFK
jgi:hypothetical protein